MTKSFTPISITPTDCVEAQLWEYRIYPIAQDANPASIYDVGTGAEWLYFSIESDKDEITWYTSDNYPGDAAFGTFHYYIMATQRNV